MSVIGLEEIIRTTIRARASKREMTTDQFVKIQERGVAEAKKIVAAALKALGPSRALKRFGVLDLHTNSAVDEWRAAFIDHAGAAIERYIDKLANRTNPTKVV